MVNATNEGVSAKTETNMSDKVQKPSEGWGRVKRWVVGLTSVLVVVPALINGGLDVYKTIANVPKTYSERTNNDLFHKYFNKSPLVTIPIPIHQSVGTIEIKLSVFEAGDIYVEYGNNTQWFAVSNFPWRQST